MPEQTQHCGQRRHDGERQMNKGPAQTCPAASPDRRNVFALHCQPLSKPLYFDDNADRSGRKWGTVPASRRTRIRVSKY
jgi:hypothetical protein